MAFFENFVDVCETEMPIGISEEEVTQMIADNRWANIRECDSDEFGSCARGLTDWIIPDFCRNYPEKANEIKVAAVKYGYEESED